MNESEREREGERERDAGELLSLPGKRDCRYSCAFLCLLFHCLAASQCVWERAAGARVVPLAKN